MSNAISIQGARTHNLANIDLILPRNQLIVVTGPSGSGKSSLVFDTLYAEGQRRYIESLSAYARQFLSMMEKPAVDAISGLSPAIAIQQKSTSHNPRSTVGTITEIYDYLRVLFARVGKPHCPQHNTLLSAQTLSQMAENILNLPPNTRFMLLAPLVQARKGEYTQLLLKLRQQGYLRIRLDGKILELDSLPAINPRHKHQLEVVIDRLILQPNIRARLTDSLATTLQLSEGLARIMIVGETGNTIKELTFSARSACPACNFSLPELEPRLFSFNNPLGACPQCDGLGVQDTALFQETSQTNHSATCSLCQGTRLRLEARHVLIAGYNLPALVNQPLDALQAFFTQLTFTEQTAQITAPLLREIQSRLSFLLNVGLDYLTLSRSADTLSGGEAQRIRLASQIGSGLVGVMYVLDEPSIGLHARDNARLLKTLSQLRDLGNTVIVVEHDEEAILLADHVVDIGPGAGMHGGKIVAQGTPQAIMKNPDSLTGQYLAKRHQIPTPNTRIPLNASRILRLEKAQGNNLKSITVTFPLGLMTCVTGVSGSGKSTLINDTLYPLAARALNGAQLPAAPCQKLTGLAALDKVIEIDQSPIGRTPRSNPATYTGLMGHIRELFAATLEARANAYTASRFSFNVKGGRCEACEGSGVMQITMHFLADVYIQCEVCQGRRYNQETLAVHYKEKNIYEVLGMTVETAYYFFQALPPLARKLESLIAVGLSYLRLGQNATTLSGGEAQRVKLARELAKRDTGKTLYILDEPTTGLHFHDIAQLLKILHRLRDKGNTVIVIEHNLEVIKTADWIIDLGPEGGRKGGEVLCTGTPEFIAQQVHSYTGQFLRPYLTGAASPPIF
jgi:excinuclease ABC subunit A